MSRHVFVIPAQAGIQCRRDFTDILDHMVIGQDATLGCSDDHPGARALHLTMRGHAYSEIEEAAKERIIEQRMTHNLCPRPG